MAKKKAGLSMKLDIEEEATFTVTGGGTFQQGDFAIDGGGMTQAEDNPQAAGVTLVPEDTTLGAAPAPKGKKKKGLGLDFDEPPPIPQPDECLPQDQEQETQDQMMGIAKGLGGGLKYDDLEKEQVLGQGASGTVWKVKDKASGQIFALKQIPLEADEAKRKQLIIELKTMHECRCDAIVVCHGLFYVEAAFYIVLELMDAGSLLDILEKSPNKCIPEIVIAALTSQVCTALRYLHEVRRLIHRDLKPPNILVNSKGQMKVADFGVSGVMSESKSVCASWVGTVTYMSPERIGGDKYGFRSDIWSLGLMILECAIGRYPYINSSTPPSLSFWDLLDLIVDKPAPKLPHDGFSPEFRQFITACLAKDPKRRPTASDCLESPFLKKYPDDFNMGAYVKSVYDNPAVAAITAGVAKLP